jgi:hypothetical protein
VRVLIDPREVRPPRKTRGAKRQAKSVIAAAERPSRATLVDATDLDGASNRRDMQATLPQVVRRLIHATTDRTGAVKFAAGEGVQNPGFDGFTEFATRTSFVPSGPAAWELGTSGDVENKAQSDYRSRTDNPLGITPRRTTFIFVTTRRWPGKTAWAARRRADKDWRDVQAYDADDLESWLELAPAVHSWLSGLLGKAVHGSVDLTGFAKGWLEATKPALTPEFMLAGRFESARAVREWLCGGKPSVAIRAETREEAIVLFASVLMELPNEDRQGWEFRAIVVRSDEAWQQLALSRDPLLLIPLFMPASTTSAERNGHRIVLPLARSDASAQQPIDVEHVGRPAAEAILKKLGVSEEVARQNAHLARRSMMAFRRVCGVRPELHQPAWASPENGRSIAQIMLVGAWDETKDADRVAVSHIAGQSYEQLDRDLVRWSREADAPVRHVGTKWMITSREDAWPLVARYVTRSELERFHDVAIEILTMPDPRLELEQEKQWMAAMLGHERRHSHTLTDGLANTLALMGAKGNDTSATAGQSAQAMASAIVRRVLEKANLDHRVWISLERVLPLLAEAAPDHFLEAVKQGSTGRDPLLRHMFTDKPNASSATTSSPHPSLLWALERLAWAPEFLALAATALARLALLDEPPGTLGNRPDRSLREIFLFSHPQTHASVATRLDAIDCMRKSTSSIAWRLMISLLPSGHEFSMNHSPAEWREWGTEQPTVTNDEYARGVRGVIARLLEDVGQETSRWKDLIRHFTRLPREDSLTAIELLESLPVDSCDETGRETMRTAMRQSISQHRSFSEASWALKVEDIARMEALYEKWAPRDLAELHRWLFAKAPSLLEGREVDFDEHNRLLSQHRIGAVKEIHTRGGMSAVINFAVAVEHPMMVGCAVAAGVSSDLELKEIMREHLVSDNTALREFAEGVVMNTFSRWGYHCAVDVICEEAAGWTPEHRAILMTFLPRDEEVTWTLVDAADEVTQAAFWRRIRPWDVPSVRFENSVRKLIRYGRPYIATVVLASVAVARSKKSPDPVLIADTLEAVISTAPSENDPLPENFTYYLGRLMQILADTSSSVPLARIARIEWQLIPVLSPRDVEPRILKRELGRDPGLFAQLVTIAFRPEGDEDESHQLTTDETTHARTAYELLSSFATLPGTQEDGAIDVEGLSRWVKTARSLLAGEKRSEIGDERIGHVLGGSPVGEDGLWPHVAVRDVIEAEESREIEHGIVLKVYNSRGMVQKDLYEGGAQERELVTRYTGYSAAMTGRWPRTAAMLRQIAEHYTHDAARSDTEVALRDHLE